MKSNFSDFSLTLAKFVIDEGQVLALIKSLNFWYLSLIFDHNIWLPILQDKFFN